MATIQFKTESPAQTKTLATRLSKLCKGGEIICLCGDLGAGKTTFVKGLARGLSIDEKKVNSPTFVIMNVYDGRLPLYHFDFYRLESHEDIGRIGYDEFLYGKGVAVIEWAERFGRLMPPEHLKIELSDTGENSRNFKMTASGEKYNKILGSLRS